VQRIALVKPDKAREVGDMLVSMAQRGQVSERISEERLKGMLTGIEGQTHEQPQRSTAMQRQFSVGSWHIPQQCRAILSLGRTLASHMQRMISLPLK